ncbi:MAG: efflux RND transporter periplasmic adaptor subunit [Deltaproteobacteria bacterium]|nr:efflux RND transporter periplasmic adaptor subunit [Deltaproteobacteria bacterium]
MKMFTRITFAILGLLAVVGALSAVKGLQIKQMIAQGESFVPPPQVVSAATVERMTWEDTIQAVGTLTAVKGLEVKAELSGKIVKIGFKSGALVSAGQLLVQQDVSIEKAQLKVAASERDLAQKELARIQTLYKKKVVSISQMDELRSRLEQAAAQVELIQASIAKKSVKAPFSGRLGFRQVNLGEVIMPGQSIVALQSLDSVYVTFQLPQQYLDKLKKNLVVRVKSDALGDQTLEGKISALNADVDSETRNIEVQAILPNRDGRLRPGMYVTVAVLLPVQKRVLTVPATAINFAPYGDSVFLVEVSDETADSGQLVLRQQFVQLGDRQGDYVAVQDGVSLGQQVVSTGVFKLRNGQKVVIDNSKAPTFETSPRPEDA